jgi:hypothetical protein
MGASVFSQHLSLFETKEPHKNLVDFVSQGQMMGRPDCLIFF